MEKGHRVICVCTFWFPCPLSWNIHFLILMIPCEKELKPLEKLARIYLTIVSQLWIDDIGGSLRITTSGRPRPIIGSHTIKIVFQHLNFVHEENICKGSQPNGLLLSKLFLFQNFLQVQLQSFLRYLHAKIYVKTKRIHGWWWGKDVTVFKFLFRVEIRENCHLEPWL